MFVYYKEPRSAVHDDWKPVSERKTMEVIFFALPSKKILPNKWRGANQTLRNWSIFVYLWRTNDYAGS